MDKLPLLIETARVQSNMILDWPVHENRMKQSLEILGCQDVQFKAKPIWDELQSINGDRYKLRIVYNDKIFKFKLLPYHLKKVKTLKLVNADLDYSLKYLDRTILKRLFDQRGQCDDILIIKEGMVTDSYYCNVAFLDNEKWYTPASPLLAGTQRQKLIEQALVIPKEIPQKDISQYQSIRLFNAMIDFGEIELDVANIF